MSEQIPNHSPLPWATHPQCDRVLISLSEPDMSLLGESLDGSFIVWKKEDAELIVKAVNCHDELLAACESALACLEYDPANKPVMIKVRAAIAKAKGQA